MVDVSAIAAATSSLKTAGEIVQAMIGLRDAAAFQTKAIELQRQILAAQQSALAAHSDQFTLLQRISDLEKEIARVKAWDAEKERYQLKAIDNGAFAFMLKPEAQGSEPAHWLCTNCFGKGHKGFLQYQGQVTTNTGGRGMHATWACATCKTSMLLYYTRKPSVSWEPKASAE